MTLGNAMGLNPLLVGGAVMSGVFVGDRGSPMSTGALLISELTGTDLYSNVKGMMKTAVVPFAGTVALYALLGTRQSAAIVSSNMLQLFKSSYNLHPLTALPAIIIVVLCLLRVRVRIAMIVSILVGIVISVVVQGEAFLPVMQSLILGHRPSNPELVIMLGGGGVLSMLRVLSILSLSATYSGIFSETGLLKGVTTLVGRLSKTLTPYTAMVITSLFVNMVTCNQTLAIILTHFLFKDAVQDRNNRLPIDLSNTVLIMAPLVPWSVASAGPLTAAGASPQCLPFAFFLHLLPLWNWFRQSDIKRLLRARRS